MELADGDTDGSCGHQTAGRLEKSETEQQQGMAVENSAAERVNVQENQQLELGGRTVPAEDVPETDTQGGDTDANRDDGLNVFSCKEAGVAVEGESVVCRGGVNDASEEDNRRINSDIMLGNPLIETQMKNEDTSSLVHLAMKDHTDEAIQDASEKDRSEFNNDSRVENSLSEAQRKSGETYSLAHPSMGNDTDGGINDAGIGDVSPEGPEQPQFSELGLGSGEDGSGDGKRHIVGGTDVLETEPQTSMSHVPEAGGTAEAADREVGRPQATTESAIDGVGHNQATVRNDALDDMFSTGQRGSQREDVRQSYFPALDNVDFETDEEGQEFEKDGGDAETGQKMTGSRQKSEDASHGGVQKPTGHDGSDSKQTVMDSTVRQDYPLNYQNYKVCREVRPGVKECLILETGEQFFCISKPQTQPDGTSKPDPETVGAHQSAPLVQPESTESGYGGQEASAQTVDDNTVHLTSGLVSVLSRAEVFSYISLQEDGQDQTEPRSYHLVESGQQAYITENGVPVIMDSAEDDVGLGGDAENGEGAANTEREKTAGTTDDESYFKHPEVLTENVVEDVLSSEGEINWSPQPNESTAHSMKKLKKEKDKFYVLKPDVAPDTERTAESCERNSNFNNSANQMGLGGEGNTNENANSHRSTGRGTIHRGEAGIHSSNVPSSRSFHPESGNRTHSHDRGTTTPSRGVDQSGSRSFYQSTSKDSSYFGSRDYHSKDDSSYYRSKEPSSVDSSQMSTRYTRIHQPGPSSPSRPESLTVPKFKTLQDQQVSWLDMFKVIEQQHRTELQSQYLEHQKVLQEMQRNMEKELMKQQDTLKQRLMSHREMLEDLSPYRHAGQNINHSWTQSEDVSSLDSQRASEHGLTNNTSQITLQGVPVALRNPPPMSRYHHDSHEHKCGDELPVKRSLEKELQSPVKPADTSLSQTTSVSIDRDKQLRGGVYSSPFPLAHVKHKKKSPRASKSYESTQRGSPHGEVSRNSNSIHWEHDVRPRDIPSTGSPDVSFADSDDVLSPRTRITLREKHAKHLADVRAYYEKELQDLRREIQVKAGGDGRTQNATVEQRILANENQELRKKYQHLQDAYHDAKIEIRELQQKIHGLEIRAADYAERYDAAQSQVLTLKSRLEELADYVRDKESLVADLESKNRKNTDSLQLAYKKEKELADSLHNARSTIQKLVDKYETLEKDHDIVKESLLETQEKLYASRAEVIEVNNKLSRSELENKQLKHDIENLKLDLAMARSAVPMQTSYEEAYHKASSSDHHQSSYSQATTTRSRSGDRSYSYHHRHDDDDDRGETTAESESDREYTRSPLIKAEKEWKLQQQSRDFTPKLQRKFYGTEIPGSYGGPPITVDRTKEPSADSPRSSTNPSPRDKRTHAAYRGREVISRSSTSKSSSSFVPSSPVDRSRLSRDGERRSPGGTYKDRDSKKNHSMSPKKLTMPSNGLTSEQALERIKSGDVVSRPAWEDVYTSLAADRPAGGREMTTPPVNYTRDQIIKERLQNIENLEKKYDDLTNEKRKLEASLSKLPAQGHGRERDKLESQLDRVDRDLGSVRMSLKRYHVLKSTI